MGDTGDDYRAWKEHKAGQTAKTIRDNLDTLYDSEFNFPRQWMDGANGVCLFRVKGKPKADFFPSRNKWVVGQKVYYGTAQDFLNWYRKN